MSDGDIAVAIATITQSFGPDQKASALTPPFPLVTFFSVPKNPNILHLNAPVIPGDTSAESQRTTGDLPASQWQRGYVWYYWAKDQTSVLWGVVEGDTSNPVTIIPEGISTIPSASVPVSTPATTTNDPASSSSVSAASNSLSPTTTSSAKPSSGGLSDGAVAGVAIGCLIAGALLASLVAWFCLGRRRKSAGGRDSEASALALMHREKGPTAKAVSLESGSPIALAMENGLPQPLEDKAISGEISKISNLIKNHVQSYYHTGRVSPGMIDYDDIQALGSELPVSVGTLSTLLGNAATREIALRFCIAWIVVSRMQLHSPPGTSFLPPEVASCFQSMSLVDRGSRGRQTVDALFARSTNFDSPRNVFCKMARSHRGAHAVDIRSEPVLRE